MLGIPIGAVSEDINVQIVESGSDDDTNPYEWEYAGDSNPEDNEKQGRKSRVSGGGGDRPEDPASSDEDGEKAARLKGEAGVSNSLIPDDDSDSSGGEMIMQRDYNGKGVRWIFSYLSISFYACVISTYKCLHPLIAQLRVRAAHGGVRLYVRSKVPQTRFAARTRTLPLFKACAQRG